MKKLVICFLSFFILMVLPNVSQANNGFTITGNISGNLEGKKVYLYLPLDWKLQHPLDSALIKNGYFKFHGNIITPRLYNILIIKKGEYYKVISLFVENSNMVITAAIDSIPDYNELLAKSYPYNKISITGSKSHNLFVKYFNENAILRKKFTNASAVYDTYLKRRGEESKKNINEGIEAIQPIDAAEQERIEYIKHFVKTNSQNAVVLAVIQLNLSYFSANGIDTLLSAISPELKETQEGLQLIENATAIKKAAVGSQYVDFSFKDKDDNDIKLSDHVCKGKYVLLEFWASWCGPCLKNIPHLKNVYKLYHPSGFEIIQISVDENKTNWLNAVNEQQMEWLQVLVLGSFKGDFATPYNFNGIPTCILIDPNGEIVTRDMELSWMDKKLIELYGNKFEDK